MANCRYYAVAGGDIWAMRYASAELAQWINRSRMIAFVNGAVQELGTRGEGRPCMRARSCRPPTVQIAFNRNRAGHPRVSASCSANCRS